MDRPRPLFLVGFMGSGKSSVGAEIGRRLGWELVDTDRRIEERSGKPIESIFRTDGEGTFRRLEWEVLSDLVDEPLSAPGRVVATGGGLYLGYAQRRLIRGAGTSVWLDLPLEVVRRRVGAGEGRPLWQGLDAVALRVMFDKRRAVYALADRRVDAAGGDAAWVADRILGQKPPILD
ncbi:hypothetical protein ABI59_06420 [Acidobacteria bacterium Mor1]|nr:hypothetical protein ABI59_06420 [Acidobacteria bacterium Mor1]